MAYGLWPSLTTVLSVVNLALLLVLLTVWIGNYRRFNSSMVLGLIAFAVVLALENVVAIYFAFSMAELYGTAPTVQATVSVLRGLQFVALVFLTWTTRR